ncbi:MAG TPA: histidine kinase [Chitinophagaceae bacterium]
MSILLTLIGIHMNAQDQASKFRDNARKYVDSINQILPRLKGKERIDAFNHLARTYQIINPDTSRWYSRQALAESQKISYTKGEANAHMYLSRVENAIGGDSREKEKHLVRAILLLEKLKDEESLRIEYGELGATYLSQNKFLLAIEYYKKSISLTEKQGEPDMYSHPWQLHQVSEAYQQLGNYKEAFEYCLKCFEFRKRINEPFGIAESLLEMGDLYRDAGDIETANDYYHQVISYSGSEIFKGTIPRFTLARAYSALGNQDSAIYFFQKMIQGNESSTALPQVKENFKKFSQPYLAEFYLKKGEYSKSIESASAVLPSLKNNSELKEVLRVQLTIAQAYLGNKNYSAALEHSRQAYQIGKETSSKKAVRNASRILWKAFQQLGKTDSSFFYLQQYMIAKESLEQNRSANELAFFKASQEDEERQARMELLDKENKIKEQELVIQRQNLRREAFIKKYLIAGLLGLFVLGVIILRSVSLKRKLEGEKRMLAEKELQLQKLENERRITDLEMLALRSQMNPHFIFNCLNSINRFVLRNDTEAASGYLTKFSKLMRMVLENSKQTLIPLEEEVKCLELYIQMEQFRCKNAFTYYIKYHDGVNTEEAMIPPLLLQPFVENAIWHGVNPKEGDGKIGIEFFQKEEALYCVIRDNGIGRKKASELRSQLSEHHKSMGLQITKERLAIIEEQQIKESPMEIEDMVDENGKAAGTKVTVRIFSLPAFEELKSSLNL